MFHHVQVKFIKVLLLRLSVPHIPSVSVTPDIKIMFQKFRNCSKIAYINAYKMSTHILAETNFVCNANVKVVHFFGHFGKMLFYNVEKVSFKQIKKGKRISVFSIMS